MSNVIMMRDVLTFGKFKGLTGAHLMKSAEGTSYLKWIYNNTDIKMEECIINTLIGHGHVVQKPQRHNSRGETNNQVCIAAIAQQASLMGASIAHEVFHRHRGGCIDGKVLPSYKDAIGKQVRIQINPMLNADKERKQVKKVEPYNELFGYKITTEEARLAKQLNDIGLAHIQRAIQYHKTDASSTVQIGQYIRAAFREGHIGKPSACVVIENAERQCKHCTSVYTPKAHDQKYCCKSCRKAASAKRSMERSMVGSLARPTLHQLFGRAVRKELKEVDRICDGMNKYGWPL